jgi:protein-tyrosine phosphatase
MVRILFVCLGNIIRSPLAEHIFIHLARQHGVGERYSTESAGMGSYHVGESPDPRMRRVASEFGLNYDGRARQFSPVDYDRFDLIIPMDLDNQADLFKLTRNQKDEKKIITLRTFDPQGGPSDGVPDPYYGGVDGFYDTYKVVERSCQGLLDALEAGEVEF